MKAPSDPDQTRLLPGSSDLTLPWHLRLSGKLEQDFRRYLINDSRRIIAGALGLVILLLLCGSVVEYLVDATGLLHNWRPRLLVALAAMPVWWACRDEQHLRWVEPAVILFALTLGITNNYSGATINHPLAWSYYLINLLAILLMSTLFRITLYRAALASLALVLIMAASLMLPDRIDATENLVVFFIVFSGAVLTLTGHYFFERLQRRHFVVERMLSLHRSELHSANRVLENQVTEDPLTGTVNRRGMESRLNQLIQRAHSEGPLDSLYLLLFDIDFFKQYNDTYGHLAGDDCLRKIANVPKSLIQDHQDFVARYGGEEFIVVLAGIQQNDALVFAERMRNKIEKLGLEHKASRVASVVTISVGVAGMTRAVKRPEQLIERADEALYQAKRQGRNQIVLIETGDVLRTL